MHDIYGISCMPWKQNTKNTFEQPNPKFQHYSINRGSVRGFPGGSVVDSMLPMQGVVGVTPGWGRFCVLCGLKRERERKRFVPYSNIFSESFVYQVSPTNVSWNPTQVTFYFLFSLLLSCCVQCLFSCVQLFVISWTVAFQAPLFMGFSRQEYWNELSCSPPFSLRSL